MYPHKRILPLLPLLPLLPFLPHATALAPQAALASISIRQTINTYALAIDSKNFALLTQVFSPDAVANYGPPIGILNGILEISATLSQSLAPVTSQHSLTTQLVDVHPGLITANTTTYLVAALFGIGAHEGKVLYSYAKYLDDLVCVGEGERRAWDCEWRVTSRVFESMGPLIGDLSIYL